MSYWRSLAGWMYGDARGDRGFWYAHPLWEIEGLSAEQLFWVPQPNCLPIIWHVGHIAHRERWHIGRFLQGLQGEIIPPQYDIFGTRFQSVDEIRQAIDSVPRVLAWVEQVRQQSTAYIATLQDEDFASVTPTSEEGLPIGHWLFITVSHGAIHIGRIQMLRAMLEGEYDRPC